MRRKEIEDKKLLSVMIRGARRSDKELSRILKVSQPTVSRKRAKLEKQGYIAEYTVIPDLTKMGYDFVAITFLKFAQHRPEDLQKAREWARSKSSIIYATDGEGMGMSSVMLSVHENYASYSRLLSELQLDWQPNLTSTQTFIASLARPDLLIKPLSFRYLDGNP
jgi:DNA-binding Lrp family transcriptional regulator